MHQPSTPPPRLREQLHAVMRTKHYSLRTEKTYWYWIRYFIRFHRLRHPRDMAEPEVAQFLTWLATNKNVAAATQNQALNALVFLYKQVLQQPLQHIDGISRAKKPRKLPVVLSHQEAMLVISKLPSPHRLIASLMYGAGLRVSEACRLRIQDVDFSLHRLLIRSSKGGKDRTTLLPRTLFTELQELIEQRTHQHAGQHITPAPVSLPLMSVMTGLGAINSNTRQQPGTAGPPPPKRHGVSAGRVRPEQSLSTCDEACFGAGA